MKTTISKRYAIKVGTSHLTTTVKILVKHGGMIAENYVFEERQVVQTWSAKAAAQTIADHIRNDFKPEDGDVVVVDFPLMVRR